MPLNLFSLISDHREEPYIRPSLHLVQSDDTDSIASDATAPNIPGPGRNLGRLFDALGTRLEKFLNRRAGRLNRGPVAVAEEIRNLRRYRKAFILGLIRDDRRTVLPTDEDIRRTRAAVRFQWDLHHRGLFDRKFDESPIPEEIRILKKLCGKLLKYCR